MNKVYLKYYKLVFLLCILTFVNFLFGPLVRATDSGLACPDWPLCFGKWFPEFQFNIWMEVGHRFYSGVISLVFLLLATLTLKNKELRKYFLLSILLSVFLLISQILLGMYTVTELLKPITVNLHLTNAIIFFLVLVNILVRSHYLKEKGYTTINASSIISSKNIFHLVVLFFVFYQIYIGAKVSSNYAGLSCPDFPQCIGDSWMPPKDEQGVRNKLGVLHVTHRYLAYFVFLLILALQMVSIFQKWSRPSKLFVKMSFHTVVLQVIVGISNVQFRLPPIITTLHTGLAVLIITFLFISFMIRIIETPKT